uniref:Uncharacterized protein n=1 Tax=Mycena chlorophos TaxID=658473 RepID=A0ABQ0LMY4_MYCCL|nr:predicted protein [Mycena chlorophos]
MDHGVLVALAAGASLTTPAPSTPPRSTSLPKTLPEKPAKPHSKTVKPHSKTQGASPILSLQKHNLTSFLVAEESPSKPEKHNIQHVRPKPKPLMVEQRKTVRDNYARQQQAELDAKAARQQAKKDEHARLIVERCHLEANIAAVRALGDSFAADEREHIHRAHYHEVLARALIVAAEAVDELQEHRHARGLRAEAGDHRRNALDARTAQIGASEGFWTLVHKEALLKRQCTELKSCIRRLEPWI